MNDMNDTPEFEFEPAVEAGGLLFISGVVGFGEDGAVSPDPATQFRDCFAALGAVLESKGVTPAHLVEMNSYHLQFHDHMAAFTREKGAFLGGHKTAWTAIGAAELGYPGLLVEIRAVARAK